MLPEYTALTGRRGFSDHAKLRAAIVMKCECFSCITDLLDYLQNNLLIAHYCGFNIMKPLPSYWTLERFIKEHENGLLQKVMQSQVQKLYELGILDASFIALDSTPISASTQLPISIQRKSMSFSGDTRTIFWWIVSLAYRSMRSRPLPMLLTVLSLWIS